LTARTVRSYERILEKLASWAQADPSTLNEEDVRRFLVYSKVERHYAPQSIRQARGALVVFFNETPSGGWGLFATLKTLGDAVGQEIRPRSMRMK
jgi:site-specific recombinase XerD